VYKVFSSMLNKRYGSNSCGFNNINIINDDLSDFSTNSYRRKNISLNRIILLFIYISFKLVSLSNRS